MSPPTFLLASYPASGRSLGIEAGYEDTFCRNMWRLWNNANVLIFVSATVNLCNHLASFPGSPQKLGGIWEWGLELFWLECCMLVSSEFVKAPGTRQYGGYSASHSSLSVGTHCPPPAANDFVQWPSCGCHSLANTAWFVLQACALSVFYMQPSLSSLWI